HHRHITAHPACRAKKADDLVFPDATGQLDHVLGRRGNIVIIDRRSDEYSMGGFNIGTEFLRTWHAVTFVRVAERQIPLADVDPITIDFLLLQVRKRFLTHAAAVAVRVAAGADHKMLWHWFG